MHGYILSCISHPGPSNPALYVGTSVGHVVCIPDPMAARTAGPPTFNYNPSAHENETTHLALTPGGAALLSCGFDGRVCLWPNALSKMRMDRFVVLVKQRRSVMCSLPLADDLSSFVIGDRKGFVSLWKKAQDFRPLGSGPGTVGGAENDHTALYCQRHRVSMSGNKSKKCKDQDKTISCLTLLSSCGRYFASADVFGRLRGWTVADRGALEAAWRVDLAHSSSIDNARLVGNTLVTTGKDHTLKAWHVPEMWSKEDVSEVCRLKGEGVGEGRGGDMIEIWNQRRVVGFDVFSGGMICMSQDGIVSTWKLGGCGGGGVGGGGGGRGEATVGTKALKRIRRMRVEKG